METQTFARLLFFTRAAVEKDPRLARSKIGWPCHCAEGLSIRSLYIFWDMSRLSPCKHCGFQYVKLPLNVKKPNSARRFLKYCPACGMMETCQEQDDVADFAAWMNEVASNSDKGDIGLPFPEALAQLQSLRYADLLDPNHPLETSSLDVFGENFITKMLAMADFEGSELTKLEMEEAKVRSKVVTSEVMRFVVERRRDLLKSQRELLDESKEKLWALIGDTEGKRPQTRFERGDLSEAQYLEIIRQIKGMRLQVDPVWHSAVIIDALAKEAEDVVGHPFSDEEHFAFMDVYHDWFNDKCFFNDPDLEKLNGLIATICTPAKR